MKLSNFCRFSVGLMAFLCASSVMADQAPNPRSVVAVNSAPRTNAKVVTRGNGDNGVVVNRTGAGVARTGRADTVVRSGHKNTVARSAASVVTTNRSADTTARSAVKAKVSRSATIPGKVNARAATNVPTKSGMARAATLARATAVFNDISKIGGGYAQCRESYATCMDQFCANANDTYRRCFCSQRFSGFRDTEAALEEVKVLLQRFEDNNLNAVDKTAAEVNAMYTATVGEAAIKNDVSGAQKTLSEIGDLLSGKKKAGEQEKQNPMDMSFGFDINMDDLWGSTNSMFDSGNQRTNVADLEGQALYNEVNKQCLEFVTDTCTTDAVLNMATSSYNVMIAQDCNLYEKKIDAQRETVMNTVRQAEKYLRQARLEEYRAHNSADVNECLGKVREAMLQDTACGESYKRCLDYTGNYINQNGDVIYSQKLFKLTQLIDLYGSDGMSSDIIGMNPNYNRWFDEKRMYVTTALDSCRDIADTVWREFKRTAIIEIAQAQEAKLEEVRSSCISTITECYDTQSTQLNDMDGNTADVAGAIGVRAASASCKDKVMACAALYGNGAECQYDAATRKITNPETCGLTELIDYVGLVDSAKIAEKCVEAMDIHLKDLCTPTSGDITEYPYKCRLMTVSNLKNSMKQFVLDNCYAGDMSSTDFDTLTDGDKIKMNFNRKIEDVKEGLDILLTKECLARDGYWVKDATGETKLKKFYSDIFGGKEDASDIGYCVENTTRVRCLNYNESGKDAVASYDLAKDECTFTDDWFVRKCEAISGYFEDGMCYVP